jgi:hypothetical protein
MALKDVLIGFEPKFLEEIDDAAAQKYCSRNHFIRDAVHMYIHILRGGQVTIIAGNRVFKPAEDQGIDQGGEAPEATAQEVVSPAEDPGAKSVLLRNRRKPRSARAERKAKEGTRPSKPGADPPARRKVAGAD